MVVYVGHIERNLTKEESGINKKCIARRFKTIAEAEFFYWYTS